MHRTALTLVALIFACADSSGAAPGESSGGSASATTSSSSSGPQTTALDTTSGSSSGAGSTAPIDPCTASWDPGPPIAWPSYGLDPSNTRSNPVEAAITAQNVHCLETKWSVDGLVGVTSTPAVVDDVVYVGTWAGALRAYALEDGGEIWAADVGVQVNSSPLVDGETVYFSDAGGDLHAVDRETGATVWSVELDAHPDANIFSSPVIAGNTLVIGVASIELALQKPDYTFRGAVVGLDPNTGDELWRTFTTADDATGGAGVSVWSTAAVDESRGLIYIGTGNSYEAPAAALSDSLLAIDYSDGSVVWSRQFTADDVYTIFGGRPNGPDADVGAAPNLFAIDDRDVVGVGDKAGVYSVLDRESGETVWATQLMDGSHLGGIMTTAAVSEDAIYLVSNTWENIFFFDHMGNTSVTFALERATGDVLWQTPHPRPAFGALTLAGGVVYHGTIDGTVYGLSAADGTELWTDVPGADIGGGFSIVGGQLVVSHGFWFLTEPGNPDGGVVVYSLPN